MFIELTTGKDSFRAQGSSSRRNVSLQTFVRVDDDGEGNKVIPVFAAYQRKLKYFKETSLKSTIPATEAHGPAIGGCWYVNQHEMRPYTEVLLEYRQRDSTPGSFGERVEYLMLVCNPDAALYNIQLQLPYHHLSAVPYIFFTGRFDVISSDDMLTSKSIPIWKDYFDLGDEFNVSDLLDPNQEEQFWSYEILEEAVRNPQKIEKIEGKDGKSRLKVRRSRNIRIRR